MAISKQLKKAAKADEVEVDPAEAKKQRKAAKRAAAEAAAAEEEVEVDPAEAKRQKKAAKKAAAEAAAAAEAEQAEQVAEDPAEAKKKKKAAKKAAAEAAPAAQAEPAAEEEDPAEAKKKRKAAKKAAAAAAAAEKEEEEEAPKKKSKKEQKKAAVEEEEEDEEMEAPKKEVKKAEQDDHLEVFVGGLSWDTTEEVLKKDFKECGEIVNFKLPMNDEGKPKGIAFIEFADAAAVEKALAFNGTEYGGRWIKVNKSNEKPSKDGAKGKGKDGKSKGKGKDGKDGGKGKGSKEFEIFIGGLPWETTEDVLKKDFAECGEIVAFRMPLNDEGKARGIAFCEYTNEESVGKALKFDGTDYGGRTLSVRKSGDPAPAKGDKGKGKGKDGKGKGNSEFEVFVGGVPDSATEDSLKKAFADCGELDRLRLPLNEEGKPKGIAFISFKDKDSCDKAVAMTDTEMDGSYLRVKMSGDGKGKGKDGKDGKGKGKGKKGKKGDLSADKMSARDGSMGVPEGKKTAFADSDDE